MEYEQLLGILSAINTDDSLNEGNVIEKIKEKLKEENPNTHREWEDKGFDINYMFNDEDALLCMAAWNGLKKVAELLIKNNVNVNAVEKEGWSALSLATERNHKEIVKALLEKGADPLFGNRNVDTLRRLVESIKNDGSKYQQAEEIRQRKEPVDDEYELLKYSLLLCSNCSLVDMIEVGTLDSLMCTWFADVSNLTPNQEKLNIRTCYIIYIAYIIMVLLKNLKSSCKKIKVMKI